MTDDQIEMLRNPCPIVSRIAAQVCRWYVGEFPGRKRDFRRSRGKISQLDRKEAEVHARTAVALGPPEGIIEPTLRPGDFRDRSQSFQQGRKGPRYEMIGVGLLTNHRGHFTARIGGADNECM